MSASEIRTCRAGVSLVVAILGLLMFSSSALAQLPQVAAYSASGVRGFDMDVGKNGYAVMAWSVRAQAGEGFVGNVFVRTRLQGSKAFSARRFVAKSSTSSVQVEIGQNGATYLAWPGVDGRARFMSRSPRKSWSKISVVSGLKVTSIQASVGPDGTLALASLRNQNLGNSPSRVLGAVLKPGADRPPRWRTLSSDDERIGFHADVVAKRNGRATVVWSGPCRAGKAKVASHWVDLGPRSQTFPRRIAGSGCVAWDIDLQADRFGNEYMRLGLLAGVQLATRKVGKAFREAVRVGPPGMNGGRGELSVSPNGLATLIFGTGYGSFGYHYVTSFKAQPPRSPRKLEAARTDPSGKRDALLAVAPLRGGSVAMLWSEIWPGKGGSWKKIGVKTWQPSKEFTQPRYSVNVPSNHIPFPTAIEASGNSWVAWWGQMHQRDPIGKKVLWIEP